jgi:hypothetical protein
MSASKNLPPIDFAEKNWVYRPARRDLRSKESIRAVKSDETGSIKKGITAEI